MKKMIPTMLLFLLFLLISFIAATVFVIFLCPWHPVHDRIFLISFGAMLFFVLLCVPFLIWEKHKK